MKQILFGLLAAVTFMMTSCETTREININADGKGTLATTVDLGGLVGMAKMSGQGEGLDKMDRPVDTVINLSTMADSIPDLTPEQRAILRTGKLSAKVNMESDQFLFKVDFPFNNVSEISHIDKLTGKVMQEATKNQMGKKEDAPPGPVPDASKGAVEEYFVTTYSKGLIESKLNAEKYAAVAENEMMQGMKEMAGMGMGKTTVIIKLPNAAKKVEGANTTVSADKKTVTIVSSLEDFFDDAKKMEYRIEY
ncbi:MAG: hypothetical protein ABWZ25_16525 [Chitinophagaceae bacterium]